MFIASQANRYTHPELLNQAKAALELLLAKARRFLIEEDEYGDLLDLVEFFRPTWVSEIGDRRVNVVNTSGVLVVTEIAGDQRVLSHYSIPLVLSLRDRCLELCVLHGCTRVMKLHSNVTEGV